MNGRRIPAAAIPAWFVSIPLGALIHHGVLGAVYAADAAAFRTDAETVRRLPIGYGVQLIGFFVAASMYARRPSRQGGTVHGLEFGLSLGVLVVAFAVVVWNYVTQPIPIRTGVFEVLEYLVVSMISGAVIEMVCQIRNTANDDRQNVSA